MSIIFSNICLLLSPRHSLWDCLTSDNRVFRLRRVSRVNGRDYPFPGGKNPIELVRIRVIHCMASHWHPGLVYDWYQISNTKTSLGTLNLTSNIYIHTWDLRPHTAAWREHWVLIGESYHVILTPAEPQSGPDLITWIRRERRINQRRHTEIIFLGRLETELCRGWGPGRGVRSVCLSDSHQALLMDWQISQQEEVRAKPSSQNYLERSLSLSTPLPCKQ